MNASVRKRVSEPAPTARWSEHTAPIMLSLPFLACLDILALLFSEPSLAMLATVAIQGLLVVYGYQTRPLGLLFSFFVVSTFTFLTGRMLVVGVFGYKSLGEGDWGLHLSDPKLINGALLMQQVFLLFAWIGVLVTRKRVTHDFAGRRLVSNQAAITVGALSMVAGSALYLQNRVGVVSSVSQSSYLDYYSSRTSLVSTSGRIGESLLIVGFAFVLAGLPRFRHFVLASGLLVAVHGFDLLMGRRAPFVLSLLVVLFYAILRAALRDRIDGAGDWPRASKLAISSLLLLPMLEMLNLIGRVRFRSGKDDSGALSAIPEFLFSQGVSANLLTYVQTDLLQIPKDKFYSLGPAIEFAQVRLMPGFDSSLYDTQSPERALAGHNFADIVSYRIMPEAYVQGAGYGSSAVAELFWDFSWVGVAVGALVLGIVLAASGRLLELPVPLAATAVIISRQILYVPRAPFLDWLVGSLNVFNIAALLFVTIAWKLSNTRRDGAPARRGRHRAARPQRA